MALFFPPRAMRMPASELGPARGPLPLSLRGAIPPAGFVPGLPPGLSGLPEFEYWHDPRTGQLWSRARAAGPTPTRVLLGAPASVVGRGAQRSFVEREREPSAVRPSMPGGPTVFSGDFLRGFVNVAGNLLNNVLRVAAFHVAGPVAPIIAPLIPTIRIGAPVVTQVAQPEPVAPISPVGRLAHLDPFGQLPEREAVFELQTGGRVTEVVEGRATVEVQTVRGVRTVEVDLPFPEVGLPQ